MMLENFSDESKHPIIHAFTQEASESYAQMPSVSRAVMLGTAAMMDAVREAKTVNEPDSGDEVY